MFFPSSDVTRILPVKSGNCAFARRRSAGAHAPRIRVPGGDREGGWDVQRAMPRRPPGRNAARIALALAALGLAARPASPGHATAIVAAYPELASIPNPPKSPSHDWGILPNLLNPSEATFTFLGTVLDELERRDLATGLVTLCIGGGMGIATIIERV